MPAAWPSIVAAAAWVKANVGFATLASMALSAASLIFASQRAINTAPAGPSRTEIRSAVEPARWIVGEARVGGQLVSRWYLVSDRRTPGYLWLMLVLAEGECDSVQRVWADGREITFSTAAGSATATDTVTPATQILTGTDDWAGKFEAWVHFAGDRKQGAEFRAQLASDRTLAANNRIESMYPESFRFANKSWVAVKLTQPSYTDNSDRFWSSYPQLNFLVRGLKLTWPGQTTPVWTESAAAIRYWWLTVRRGIPATDIDEASVRAAHAVCNAFITPTLPPSYAGYAARHRRYALGGVIRSGDDAAQVEHQLDFAWQGYVVEQGGTHYFRPGADRPAADTIPAEDIISVGSVVPAPSLQDRVNAARATLAQERHEDFMPYSLPEHTDTDALARDGQRLVRNEGQLVFVNNALQGGRLLAIALKRARGSLTMILTVKPGSSLQRMGILPSDVVRINEPELGLVNFGMTVQRAIINADWSITFELHEYLAGTFDDELVLPPLTPRLPLPGEAESSEQTGSIAAPTPGSNPDEGGGGGGEDPRPGDPPTPPPVAPDVAAPTDVSATAQTARGVVVVQFSPQASLPRGGYRLQYRSGRQGWPRDGVIADGARNIYPIRPGEGVTEYRYRVGGLQDATRYEFRVGSDNQSGNVNWSPTVHATTAAAPPRQPPGLRVNGLRADLENMRHLAWTALLRNPLASDQYSLMEAAYRRTSGSNFPYMGTIHTADDGQAWTSVPGWNAYYNSYYMVAADARANKIIGITLPPDILTLVPALGSIPSYNSYNQAAVIALDEDNWAMYRLWISYSSWKFSQDRPPSHQPIRLGVHIGYSRALRTPRIRCQLLHSRGQFSTAKRASLWLRLPPTTTSAPTVTRIR